MKHILFLFWEKAIKEIRIVPQRLLIWNFVNAKQNKNSRVPKKKGNHTQTHSHSPRAFIHSHSISVSLIYECIHVSVWTNARSDFCRAIRYFLFLSICESKLMKIFQKRIGRREKFSFAISNSKLLRTLNKRWVSKGQTFTQ